MTSQTLTYLAGGPEGKIVVKTSNRAIGGVEVLVKVTYSGLCGTDAHDRTDGCGLGHEGVGVVEVVGAEVTAVKIGDRVGWGWQFASCGHCRECVDGVRQYCPQSRGQKYGEREQGAFGDYVVKHQDFVYPIPDEIESKYAGPLNCAGITVYEALDVAGTKPSDTVGVVGMGGLGHLAVMYAKAMGCDVAVISSSDSKRNDAFALGASEFINLREDKQPKIKSGRGINVLLLCGGGDTNFDALIPLLDRRAAIVCMVIQSEPLVIPYMPFLLPGHRIIASTEASRRNHIDALTFAAKHGIKPWIEEFPMTVGGLTSAFEALAAGKIKYRAVLSREMGFDGPS